MAATADPLRNPYGIAHIKKRAFLASYANNGNIRASCKAAGVTRRIYYYWQERDEQFSAACHLAKAEYGDALEAELTRQVMSDHNTTALIVALKMAGRFVDTQRQEHSGPGGTAIRTETKNAVQLERLSDADLQELDALIVRATDG
jgi:hypothetical protein